MFLLINARFRAVALLLVTPLWSVLGQCFAGIGWCRFVLGVQFRHTSPDLSDPDGPLRVCQRSPKTLATAVTHAHFATVPLLAGTSRSLPALSDAVPPPDPDNQFRRVIAPRKYAI